MDWTMMGLVLYALGAMGTYAMTDGTHHKQGHLIFSIFWLFDLMAVGFVAAFVKVSEFFDELARTK